MLTSSEEVQWLFLKYPPCSSTFPSRPSASATLCATRFSRARARMSCTWLRTKASRLSWSLALATRSSTEKLPSWSYTSTSLTWHRSSVKRCNPEFGNTYRVGLLLPSKPVSGACLVRGRVLFNTCLERAGQIQRIIEGTKSITMGVKTQYGSYI